MNLGGKSQIQKFKPGNDYLKTNFQKSAEREQVTN